VLVRNYQPLDAEGRPMAEADIVAERGELLVFVEVRSRSTDVFGDPEETITKAKRRRIVRAALFFLTENQIHERPVRFDVISVVHSPSETRVQHFEDAFDAGM
jgi:putative endonuclease